MMSLDIKYQEQILSNQKNIMSLLAQKQTELLTIPVQSELLFIQTDITVCMLLVLVIIRSTSLLMYRHYLILPIPQGIQHIIILIAIVIIVVM